MYNSLVSEAFEFWLYDVPISYLNVFLVAGLSLLFWRLYRFTILPILHPKDPKELPYWIPFLGHAIGFFVNSYRVLDQGRIYFGNTREPYSLTVAGQKILIVTSPEDVQSLYKHTESFSWLTFVQDLYRWVGLSQASIDKLWSPPTKEQKMNNPRRKLPPNQMIEEYEHHQLLPGKNHDDIASKFAVELDKLVSWRTLRSRSCYKLESTPDFVKISLIDWTSEVFILTITQLYWGKCIFETDPNLLQTFRQWEETNWKYVFQLPRVLSKDTYAARDGIVNAFTKYFQSTKESRADISYFVEISESELRDIALEDSDIARVHMLQMWAVNGNVHKVTFWIFAYLLHYPELLSVVSEEVKAGMLNGKPNVPHLLDHCPRLEAIYLEVLRLRMSSSLMRSVVKETVVGGKIFRKRNNVMVPYRQLHLNTEFWGPDAAEFKAERFLHDKNLAKSSNYRPFGGGQHLCPGRFLAKKVVFSFIALALSRFEISLDTKDELGKPRFPRADERKPALGTLAPVAGDEVILKIRPKRTL